MNHQHAGTAPVSIYGHEVIWHRLWKSHHVVRCHDALPAAHLICASPSYWLASLGHRVLLERFLVERYTVPNAAIKNWARDPDPETHCIVLSPTALKCFRRSPGSLSDFGLDTHTTPSALFLGLYCTVQ